MKLKTIDDDLNITLEDYDEAVCRGILAERDNYALRCVRCYGEDYGGSHCSEEKVTTVEEIVAERILVKDGHFSGVSILAEYDCYNGGSANEMREALLLIDGKGDREVRTGFSFANDDHSRWDYTDISLFEKE